MTCVLPPSMVIHQPNGLSINRKLCLVSDRHPRNVPPQSCTRPYRLLINLTWSKENPRNCRGCKKQAYLPVYVHDYNSIYTYYNILYHKGSRCHDRQFKSPTPHYIFILVDPYIYTYSTNKPITVTVCVQHTLYHAIYTELQHNV